MECNRDEALKAKTIAEEKFGQKDLAGAKKFALKSQALYPEIDGLSHMLTTLDIYISAENKISGEVDWYGVLGVNTSADDETLRKQYRNLALVLHPDKNKSVGAEGAFKLLSEAWSLLSDKSKRLAYNQRRSSNAYQRKAPMHSGGPSAPQRNGFHNFTSKNSASKTHNSATRMPSSSVHSPSYQRTDTFWTVCHRCKMHYEYLKIYLNRTLLCPTCHKAFLATEAAPPLNYTKSSATVRPGHQNLGKHAPNGNHFVPGRNGATVKSSGSAAAGSNSANYSNFQQDPFSVAAKAANVVKQAHEKMKRKCDDGFNRPHYTERAYHLSGTYSKINSTRELTPLEARNMLMERARKEIFNKLNEWRSESVTKPQDKQKYKVKESKKGKQRNSTVR